MTEFRERLLDRVEYAREHGVTEPDAFAEALAWVLAEGHEREFVMELGEQAIRDAWTARQRTTRRAALAGTGERRHGLASLRAAPPGAVERRTIRDVPETAARSLSDAPPSPPVPHVTIRSRDPIYDAMYPDPARPGHWIALGEVMKEQAKQLNEAYWRQAEGHIRSADFWAAIESRLEPGQTVADAFTPDELRELKARVDG